MITIYIFSTLCTANDTVCDNAITYVIFYCVQGEQWHVPRLGDYESR